MYVYCDIRFNASSSERLWWQEADDGTAWDCEERIYPATTTVVPGENREVTSQIWFSRILRRFSLWKKKPTDLSLWQKGLCILDVFAAHRSNEFLNVMAIKNTSCVRQHKLQPFKIILKNIWKEHKERISAVLCTLNWKITWWHRTGKRKNKFKTSCYQRKACTVAYKCYTKNVQHKKKWFNDL